MLFGSIALEVAIGIIFVYLLLSLLCSAIVEYIEAKANNRAKLLKDAVSLLLDQTSGGEAAAGSSLAARLYSHPLVKSLYREGKLPSYIPSRTFALALWDMAFPPDQRGGAGGAQNLAAIRSAIISNTVVNPEVKRALLALVDDAGNNFEKARQNIEDWYEGAMDRASGWYKRRAQVLLLILGFVVSAVVNADTINLAKALVQNDALRATIVAEAETRAKLPLPSPTPPPTDPVERERQARADLDQAYADITKLGLPIGWVRPTFGQNEKGEQVLTNAADLRRVPHTANGWILKVLGILITGFAISQGAPFWFDLLNKFIVIRSTVKPKEKSQEQPSKDRPAPETELEQDDANKN